MLQAFENPGVGAYSEESRDFMFFMRFGPRGSFYGQSSSGGQNLDVEKFQFQIISKPFDRSTSYMV